MQKMSNFCCFSDLVFSYLIKVQWLSLKPAEILGLVFLDIQSYCQTKYLEDILILFLLNNNFLCIIFLHQYLSEDTHKKSGFLVVGPLRVWGG